LGLNLKRPGIFAGLAGLLLVVGICAQAAEKVTWKLIADAMVRIDDRALKQWSLYRVGKKSDPLLLQMGSRALVIYVRNQAVYEIPPSKLDHKGTDLLWRETDKPEKPLATSEWSMRDVGSALRIQMKLVDEGRLVDIQIPQTPDLRGLLH
jgi:hypothetical protein